MASAEYQREYRARCKAADPEKFKAQRQEESRRRHEKIKSQHSEEELKEQYRQDWLKRSKSMSDEERQKRREKDRVAAQKARLEIFALLGNACIRCGFSDVRALQVDHIDGGGRQERNTTGYGPNQLLKQVRQGGEGKYQILCANCNQIKRHESGEFRKA